MSKLDKLINVLNIFSITQVEDKEGNYYEVLTYCIGDEDEEDSITLIADDGEECTIPLTEIIEEGYILYKTTRVYL